MHDTFKFGTDKTPKFNADAPSKFTTIDVPGASLTTAAGINDHGQIVGAYVDSTGQRHGYLDTNGRFTTIDPPGATSAEASGINDRGQIVGFYSDSTGQHGFLDTNGTFTTINFPGASATDVTGINDHGQIVGVYEGSTGPHGFVDTNGSFTTLELPGTTNGSLLPLGINDRGQIDGLLFQDRGMGGPPPHGLVAHGFLDTNGTFTTIDFPGAGAADATGINDHGQIVGVYGADLQATQYFLDTQRYLYHH
jgi:probable HAF family extracellular repeat protein